MIELACDPLPARSYMPNKAATEDWATPPELVDLVHRIFDGVVHLDPASNPYAVTRAERQVWLPEWTQPVEATDDEPGRPAFAPGPDVIVGDGLEVPWNGHVFNNPPYGPGLTDFMERAVRAAHGEEGGHVLMLAPSKTSRACWQSCVPRAAAVCFLDGRVSYLLPGGKRQTATFSSSLILWTRSRELVHRFAWYADGKAGHLMFPR